MKTSKTSLWKLRKFHEISLIHSVLNNGLTSVVSRQVFVGHRCRLVLSNYFTYPHCFVGQIDNFDDWFDGVGNAVNGHIDSGLLNLRFASKTCVTVSHASSVSFIIHATLCKRDLCLSVTRRGTVSKRLNVSSSFLAQRLASAYPALHPAPQEEENLGVCRNKGASLQGRF